MIKKRTGPHETTIRESAIGVQGLRLGAVLQEFQSVLRGTPTYSGPDAQLLTGKPNA